jgi:hypothetical protein
MHRLVGLDVEIICAIVGAASKEEPYLLYHLALAHP